MSAVIRVALSRKTLQIEPGQRGELSVAIQNLSEIVDQYVVEVEGLDPAWLTLSPPRISLFPQDEGQVIIKLHPPQQASAGTYDLGVKVVSRENPVEWTSVEVTLGVAPRFHFDVNLAPQRQSIVEEGATFDVQLTNSGNLDVTLNLSASDPEEGCTYQFDRSEVTVGAGETAVVSLEVMPKHSAREQGKLYNFAVKATPVDAPDRARAAVGQLECEPQVVSLELELWPRKRSAVGAGTFQVQLANQGNTDISLVLEGTDPAEACAYRFEPQSLMLRAGESRQVPLTVAPIGKPPTDQPRLYDFMVRAVPQHARHKAVQASGQLECLPVVISFDMEILPGQRTVRREGQFDVRLVNRSETSLSLELRATDENEACDFQFESSRVSLGPEEAKMVTLRVTLRERPAAGESTSHTFTVEATPADAPHLTKKATGRIEATRRQGIGVLAWSTAGFAMGNAVLNPVWQALGFLPEIQIFGLLLAIWGAVGGLFLSIGIRRRVLFLWLAGAVGLAPGAILLMNGVYDHPEAQAVLGAVLGVMLGLGMGYRWKAIALAAAGAIGFALGTVVWPSVHDIVIDPLGQMPAWVAADAAKGAIIGAALGLATTIIEPLKAHADSAAAGRRSATE